MMEKRYCYCCRSYHPAEQVVLFETKVGKRWRCTRTIEAARSPSAERDSFGQQQSVVNKALASRQAQESLLLRHSSVAFA